MDRLRCIVERITYQNDQNGYSVIKCKAKGYNDLVTVVGAMPEVHVGAVLTLTGMWKIDAKYGRQFSIETFEETLPATVFGIEKYLGSGLIKGIGSKFAKRIVQAFGTETLNVIEESPDDLIRVPGIGKVRVERIKKSWVEQKEIKNIMLFLQSHNVSTTHATKIWKTYGNESLKVVQENPYRLADDIWGIGFKTADTIAEKLGFEKEKYVRLRSGLLYTLNRLSDEGHCFATREQLLQTGTALLDVKEPLLSAALDEMIRAEDVKTEQSPQGEIAIYLPPFYFSEIGTARRLHEIASAPRTVSVNLKGLADRIAAATNMNYDPIQLQAIETAVRSKILILTGGPGTGKTTTTLGIISAFQSAGAEILLAAPTGRAAKRLSEATGLEAKTIHRLLEVKPPEGYQRNEENPLEGDVLILDECSMIDIMLMYALLRAVPDTMTLMEIWQWGYRVTIQNMSGGRTSSVGNMLASRITMTLNIACLSKIHGKGNRKMLHHLRVACVLAVLILLTACGSANPEPKENDSATATASTMIPIQESVSKESDMPPNSAQIESSTSEASPDSGEKVASETDAIQETVAPEPWEWTYCAPESQGMDADALAALHKTYGSFPLLSAVIVRNGVIVDTYYEDGYDMSSVFTLQSVSKSITGALAGIALEQGYIENLDVPLADYFPELRSSADSRWARITLRHLLNHSSGIASTDSSIWYDWRSSENWLDYLFALPIYTEPGANFDYSTGNTHLLSAVLEQATGKPLGDYAREVLFEPLGMTSAGLGTAPEGVGDGGNGFSMTTLDLARFGLMYLNGGVWQGRQIVPAGWVEASTTTQAKRASDGSRYGYQWWVRTFSGHEAFVAQGHYGQYIIAVPDLSLLIAMNSNYEGSSSIYWQIANDVIAACGN